MGVGFGYHARELQGNVSTYISQDLLRYRLDFSFGVGSLTLCGVFFILLNTLTYSENSLILFILSRLSFLHKMN
jgi:hypothetical protein